MDETTWIDDLLDVAQLRAMEFHHAQLLQQMAFLQYRIGQLKHELKSRNHSSATAEFMKHFETEVASCSEQADKQARNSSINRD